MVCTEKIKIYKLYLLKMNRSHRADIWPGTSFQFHNTSKDKLTIFDISRNNI